MSSYVTSRSGCGSVDVPWTLRAGPGQRINLTLIDFSTAVASASDGSASGTVCRVYAVIREIGGGGGDGGGGGSGGLTRMVCGGQGIREEHVMLSVADTIEIRMIGKRQKDVGEDQLDNFMIAYQCMTSLMVHLAVS